MREALEIAIDYMNERLEDHDVKYKRHPATEAERINILADIETVKESLAQPDQEPVAWQQVMERAFWRMYDHGKDNNPVSAQCEIQALRLLCDGTFDDVTAWHPSQWKLPQRTWVGLTDEQCDAIYDALDEFAREFDRYEFGLPSHLADSAREIIRAAVKEKQDAA